MNEALYAKLPNKKLAPLKLKQQIYATTTWLMLHAWLIHLIFTQIPPMVASDK